ncbi:response regulator transcription factor [Guggenheimella bovis]
MTTVLITDDDREINRAIKTLLEAEGIRALQAYDGIEALNVLEVEDVDLVLLDIMMPRMDGLSTLVKIRSTKNIPVLMLSAKSEESDKIVGLGLGSDDYITKPFSSLELIARVKSHLRRYQKLGGQEVPSNDMLIVRGLKLDRLKREFYVDNELVHLTNKEFSILELLMSHPSQVFSADQIYENVWNEDPYNAENTIMVHVRRIREKIEINPKDPSYLKVVWGIGYKIEA